MTVNKYIRLINSNSSLDRRFKAIAMKPQRKKMQSIDTTIGGKVDKAAGPIIRTWSYVLRVPLDDPTESAEGSWADLQTFYSYNNPNGTPSDILTLYDHFGSNFSVFFVGDETPEPLTTMLEGPNAWYIVPVTFREAV